MNAYSLLIVIIAAAIACGVGASECQGAEWVVWMLRAASLLLVALAFVFHFKIIRPLSRINLGADLLRAREFSTRLAKVGQPDIDRIIDIFNRMMAEMRSERLRKQEQDTLLSRLLDVSPLGVVMVNDGIHISLVNPAARTILAIPDDCDPEGLRFDSLKGDVVDAMRSLPHDAAMELRLSDSTIYRISRHGFMNLGYQHPFYIIEVLTDEVRSAERRSYGKVIRIMSHEVNNLMAGVTSTLDTLTGIFDDTDPDISESLRSCSDRCRETSQFIGRLAEAVKIPAPQPVEVDLGALLSDMRPMLQSLCSPRGVEFVSSIPEKPVIVRLDPVLIEQAVVNIVKNGAESAADYADGRVEMTLTPDRLVISDNGPGISPEVSRQLFTPFFTTRPEGHGIGLTVVREILSSHKLRFSLTTPSPRHTLFAISLRP